MAKFIMSIGDEAFNVLSHEAKTRDVTVQQLLRAVVVPEWIKGNLEVQARREESPQILRNYLYAAGTDRSQMLVSPAARLRQ